MPRGSFKDAVRRRQEAGFVARTGEISRYRANLSLPVDDPNRRFVFVVHGDGGVGKTFLLRRLRSIAEESGAAVGWVDEPVFGVPEAMQSIAADLSRQGADLKGFTRLLSTYLQRRLEVEADSTAPTGAAALITQTTVRVGLHAATAVPGVGGLANVVDPEVLADQANQLRLFLGKKFRRQEDVQMLLSPLDALTPVFVRDLAAVGRRRPLALFFDTYEQTGPLLDAWLRAALNGDFGDLPENLVVTVAGRRPLSLDWGPWAAVLEDIQLAPFTELEARRFLADKGVADEQVVQVILKVSGRLPLLVATLAEHQPADPSAVGDPSGDAVERFLKWEPDPERRAMALAASVPRVLNEDILEVLTAGQAEQGQLFAWLRSLPFVTHEAGRCTYHEVVRTAMLRLERRQSPSRWRARHHALAAAHRRWSLDLSPEDAWDEPSWRSCKLEETYHLLCADLAKALPGALSQVVLAGDQEVSIAEQWAQMIIQAGDDSGSEAILSWGQKLEDSLRGNPNEATVACMGTLLREGSLKGSAIVSALRTRGRALYFLDRDEEALGDFNEALSLAGDDKRTLAFRAVTYQWLGRLEEALADYNRAIDVDPGYAWAIASRGSTYGLLGRIEEALADYGRAVELASNSAWGVATRGDTYRLMGQYADAMAHYNRAIDLDPDYAWAIGRRGETHRLMGRYEEALADYARAIDLDPAVDWAFYATALVYICGGDLKNARQHLSSAVHSVSSHLAANENIVHNLYNLAVYKAALGDFSEAAQAISQAMEKSSDKYRAREAIGDFRDLESVPGMNVPSIVRLRELIERGLN